jgi:hypothetical protein
MKLSGVIAGAAIAVTLGVGAAQAAQATYTISGTAPGTFNGTPFTAAAFLMTLTGDTADITENGTAQFQNHIQTATVTLAGFGQFNILNSMGIDNDTVHGESFVYTTTPQFMALSDTIDWVLQTPVDLLHSFGPVQTQFTEMLNPIDTSGGELAWQVEIEDPTIQFIVTGNVDPGPGVPEPAAWALMLTGFGLAGAALRRRAMVVA